MYETIRKNLYKLIKDLSQNIQKQIYYRDEKHEKKVDNLKNLFHIYCSYLRKMYVNDLIPQNSFFMFYDQSEYDDEGGSYNYCTFDFYQEIDGKKQYIDIYSMIYNKNNQELENNFRKFSQFFEEISKISNIVNLKNQYVQFLKIGEIENVRSLY